MKTKSVEKGREAEEEAEREGQRTSRGEITDRFAQSPFGYG